MSLVTPRKNLPDIPESIEVKPPSFVHEQRIRGRYFLITVWDLEWFEENQDKFHESVLAVVGQEEICPITLRHHLQVGVYFAHRVNGIKEVKRSLCLQSCKVFNVNGPVDTLVAYCSKTEKTLLTYPA